MTDDSNIIVLFYHKYNIMEDERHTLPVWFSIRRRRRCRGNACRRDFIQFLTVGLYQNSKTIEYDNVI